MKKTKNPHPGSVLTNRYLEPKGISGYQLSKEIDVPQTRISEITIGNRRISVDTAIRLSLFFGTTPKYWLDLQTEYDLEVEMRDNKAAFKGIKKYKSGK